VGEEDNSRATKIAVGDLVTGVARVAIAECALRADDLFAFAYRPCAIDRPALMDKVRRLAAGGRWIRTLGPRSHET